MPGLGKCQGYAKKTQPALGKVTGAYDIEWVKQKRSIQVTGTAAQLEKAEKAGDRWELFDTIWRGQH